MAPLPVIANTYRVAFDWSGYGTTAQNVMHFRKAGTTAAALAASLISAWTHDLIYTPGVSSSIDSLNVTPLDGSSPTTQYLTGSSGKWVGEASSPVSLQTAAIVKFTTQFRGRSYRGRVYWPFTGTAVGNDGVLIPAAVTAQNTAWTAFQASLTAASIALVVASYKHAFANDVTGVSVEAALATQRRRQSRTRP